MWNHHRTHRKEDYKHTQTHTGQEREENESSALLLFVCKRYETTLKAADYADALFFAEGVKVRVKKTNPPRYN